MIDAMATLEKPLDALNQRDARVVYLAGDGRSGTTLLSRIFGSYDGCLAVGEVYDIWIESLNGNRICSCGAAFHDCKFWNAVMDEAFGGMDRQTAEKLSALRESVQSVRHVPLIVFPWLRPPAFQLRLQEYIYTVERLYLAIQKVSGCQFIIDSSKLAAYAIAIAESPRIDVSFVHITRDSRACVYSWRRKKPEPVSGDDAPRYLRQRSLFRSAVVWGLRNSTLGWTARRFDVSAELRYEDFVRQPRETITSMVEGLGINPRGGHWTSDDEVLALNEHHIFAGNPNRVEQGTIRIRSDDEWRTRLSWVETTVVSGLTLPLLWKLGYIGAKQSRLAARGSDTIAHEQ